MLLTLTIECQSRPFHSFLFTCLKSHTGFPQHSHCLIESRRGLLTSVFQFGIWSLDTIVLDPTTFFFEPLVVPYIIPLVSFPHKPDPLLDSEPLWEQEAHFISLWPPQVPAQALAHTHTPQRLITVKTVNSGELPPPNQSVSVWRRPCLCCEY